MGPHPKKLIVKTFEPKLSPYAEKLKAKIAADAPMPVDKAMASALAAVTPPPGVAPPRSPFSAHVRARRNARSETLAWLKGAYPALMGPLLPLPLPLRFGDMVFPRAQEAGCTLQAVRDAIKFHCNGIAYLEAIAATGAMRCDLEGASVEPVTAKHQAFAAKRLAEIAAKLGVSRGLPTGATTGLEAKSKGMPRMSAYSTLKRLSSLRS